MHVGRPDVAAAKVQNVDAASARNKESDRYRANDVRADDQQYGQHLESKTLHAFLVDGADALNGFLVLPLKIISAPQSGRTGKALKFIWVLGQHVRVESQQNQPVSSFQEMKAGPK